MRQILLQHSSNLSHYSSSNSRHKIEKIFSRYSRCTINKISINFSYDKAPLDRPNPSRSSSAAQHTDRPFGAAVRPAQARFRRHYRAFAHPRQPKRVAARQKAQSHPRAQQVRTKRLCWTAGKV